MGSGGEITNSDGDYSLDGDGFSIQSATGAFNEERAYKIKSGNDVYGALFGLGTSAMRIESFLGAYISIASDERVIIESSNGTEIWGAKSGDPFDEVLLMGNTYVFNDLTVGGSISSSSKSFRIPHPNPELTNSYDLYHSTVESPTGGENLYRYKVEATEDNESVFIKLPDYFKYLNTDVDIYVSPDGHYGSGYGIVNANDLKVKCEKVGKYNVLVIGTRKDQHALDNWKGAVRGKLRTQ